MEIAVSREQIAELTEQLTYKRDILVLLSAEKQILLQPQTKLYLRDILDHVVLMLQQLQVRTTHLARPHLLLFSVCGLTLFVE